MLITNDLILKSGSAMDWQLMYENFWKHEEVFRYMFSRSSQSEDAAKKRTESYAQMHTQVDSEFFVYERGTNQPIGIAGIKELSPGTFTVTDIAIGPGFMGKGYGKQILNALIRFAFDERDAKELWYDCFEENTISRKLAESCGFVYAYSEEAELKKNESTVNLTYYKRVSGSRWIQ